MMGTFEQDFNIQISLSGKFTVEGPKADYIELLKIVCCIIAMDLDKSGNKKTQYLISYLLFEYIRSNSDILPMIRCNNVIYSDMSELESLNCDVEVKHFTEHPYENTFFSNHREDTLKFFCDENTVVKIIYNLELSIGKFDENNREDLVSRGFQQLALKFDEFLIDSINDLHLKYPNIPCDRKSYITENVKLDKKKLHIEPPILSKLDAAFGYKLSMNENKIETQLNNVK